MSRIDQRRLALDVIAIGRDGMTARLARIAEAMADPAASGTGGVVGIGVGAREPR
jgi:hypothetical protein